MTSIPRLDTPVGARLEAIPGAVPHPLNLPKGCKFAPRCKYATEKCMNEEPKLELAEDNHLIRCFYPDKEARHPPKGCKFHTRCKYCTEICKHITPELVEMRPGHFVACHNPLGVEKDS